MSAPRVCKDCSGVKQLTRPAPYAGPRCASHHRAKLKADRQRAHERSVFKKYGLRPGEYELLYAAQGSVCYICTRATGKAKRLAVDHDHATGFVRGLLCSLCNEILGHLRDDPAAFERAAAYLRNPPAHTILGERRAED